MDKDEIRSAMKSALLKASSNQKIYALALLAHNITICIRGVSADQLSENQTISKLNGLNEVQHTITSRLMNLALNKDEWSEDVFVDSLFESSQQDGCEGEMLLALRHTLTPIIRHIGAKPSG